MANVSGSTYPVVVGQRSSSLVNLGGFTGKPVSWSPSSQSKEDPSARSGAVLAMMPDWGPINLNIAGTDGIRRNAETVIPRESREDDDAYNRRIFHAVLPPFVQRLASQAAGTILRKGVHLDGGDEEYWEEWARDVTGDGTPLNEYCRRWLIDALLFGHSSSVVDFPSGDQPVSLADERQQNRKPYLCQVPAQMVRGWRTEQNRSTSELTMVRYMERISVPSGEFGEEIIDQVRVLKQGSYQLWREDTSGAANAGWVKVEDSETSLDEIPFVTLYSNQIATLVSKPPLLEVANLSIAYCQRFTDYYHSIHVGAQPILVMRGFDPDGAEDLGMSVNTAVLLPPDGGCEYVAPPSDVYGAQLELLKTLEDQISTLGISTLAKQNITNTAAESKRLDRIDSDSIMAIIAENLQKSLEDLLRMAGEYAGKEPPTVSIPKDYESRLLDGNQVTAFLQLYMQGVVSQECLLRILAEGEVIPPYVDIDDEILKTRDEVEEKFELELEHEEKRLESQQENQTNVEVSTQGGATSGDAAEGGTKGSMTLPTPLRPGKHKG